MIYYCISQGKDYKMEVISRATLLLVWIKSCCGFLCFPFCKMGVFYEVLSTVVIKVAFSIEIKWTKELSEIPDTEHWSSPSVGWESNSHTAFWRAFTEGVILIFLNFFLCEKWRERLVKWKSLGFSHCTWGLITRSYFMNWRNWKLLRERKIYWIKWPQINQHLLTPFSHEKGKMFLRQVRWGNSSSEMRNAITSTSYGKLCAILIVHIQERKNLLYRIKATQMTLEKGKLF